MATNPRTPPANYAEYRKQILRDVERHLEDEARKCWSETDTLKRIPRQQELARLLEGIRSIQKTIGNPKHDDTKHTA